MAKQSTNNVTVWSHWSTNNIIVWSHWSCVRCYFFAKTLSGKFDEKYFFPRDLPFNILLTRSFFSDTFRWAKTGLFFFYFCHFKQYFLNKCSKDVHLVPGLELTTYLFMTIRPVANLINYDSRVVPDFKIPLLTTPES